MVSDGAPSAGATSTGMMEVSYDLSDCKSFASSAAGFASAEVSLMTSDFLQLLLPLLP